MGEIEDPKVVHKEQRFTFGGRLQDPDLVLPSSVSMLFPSRLLSFQIAQKTQVVKFALLSPVLYRESPLGLF